jgi:serine/threonine protein kinase
MNDDAKEKVALKVLAGEHKNDKETIALLKQEYNVGRGFDHPYVLRIRQFGTDRDAVYLAMDFFDGPNLKQKIREGAERIAPQIEVIIDHASEGLHYFHDQGWVHRDIKPDNLLANDAGELKLIDFAIAQRPKTGLAKLFGGRGKIQGTRSYMSPEQIRGEALDRRADIYSFGCTVFELLTGKPPFTAGNADDLLNKHLKTAPPSVISANENVTSECAQLILETMAKRREDRPATMAEFLERFRKLKVFKGKPKKP